MNNRRHFLVASAAGSAATLLPLSAFAATQRVVVVGGGMAGATVAKYLRLWSNKTIDVTIVEQNPTYVSNIMSNLAVTGQVAMTSLNFGYTNLKQNHGIKLVTARVTKVENMGLFWRVTTVDQTGTKTTTLDAEKVVFAPGIQMDPVLDTATGQMAEVLHAWIAGPQTAQLRDKLAAMPNGGTYLLSIPAKPYRCPPGPYERACVVADYLQRNKPQSKIVVLDANPGITAEPENFGNAFAAYHSAGILTYKPSTKVESINSSTGVVTARNTLLDAAESIPADVMNIIAPHRAGAILQTVGLTNGTDKPFAKVRPYSFESAEPGMGGLYVIGDSHMTAGAGGSGLPMAGHVGNQEAKICASAIVTAFANKTVEAGKYITANSACFSPVTSTTASWLTAVYHYDSAAGKFVIHDYVGNTMGVATEASAPSVENFSKMNSWFKSLMKETFS